jgi:hypothetical protein
MTFIGLDRDRAFYPAVMIVIPPYYASFTVTDASIAGFKYSLWIVAAVYLAWLLLHSKVHASAA